MGLFVGWKIKLRTRVRPKHEQITTSAKFLETFMESDFEEQNLLCELYLQNIGDVLQVILLYVYEILIIGSCTK